jgi:hypothetical protein
VSGTTTPVRIEVSERGEVVTVVQTSFIGIANQQEQHGGER